MLCFTINADNLSSNVPDFPFRALWDDGASNPSDWCNPHRVRYGLTVHIYRRNLISNGVNLAASVCRSRFCSRLRKEAEMSLKIGGGCSYRKYGSDPATTSKSVAPLPRIRKFIRKNNIFAVKTVFLIN